MKLFSVLVAVALLSQAGSAAIAQVSRGSGHGDSAAGHKMAGVQVTHPWARAAAKTAHTGAAYVTLENAGAMADKLISASTPVAGKAELHTHIKDGDVMRMRQVQSIEVGPYTKVRLQPGGLHVMLMKLKGPLEKGSRFPLTLVFEKAGPMTVDVMVEGPGAMGPEGGHESGGMKH